MTIATAPNSDAKVFSVEPLQSQIGYFIDHKLHNVAGSSKVIEGKLELCGEEKAQLMVRASVASFKSGDSNRDLHMLEVLEGAKYPHVVLKAEVHLVDMSDAPKTLPLRLKAQVDFHGQKQMENVDLTIRIVSERQIRAIGSFVISLERYAIKRPSLLFVKLKDQCKIDFNLTLTEEGR